MNHKDQHEFSSKIKELTKKMDFDDTRRKTLAYKAASWKLSDKEQKEYEDLLRIQMEDVRKLQKMRRERDNGTQ